LDTWKECAWLKCRKRFEPSRRSNQFRRAGGAHHDGALYCSRSCQQKAYRLRRDTASATVTQIGKCTTPQATVTHPEQHIENIDVFSTKTGHARHLKVIAGLVEEYSAESLRAAGLPLDRETAAYHRQCNDEGRIGRETAWGRLAARPVPVQLDGVASDWEPCWPGCPSGWQPIGSYPHGGVVTDDLDIPDFLRRTPINTPQQRLAA
jgi:hypothetical protein